MCIRKRNICAKSVIIMVVVQKLMCYNNRIVKTIISCLMEEFIMKLKKILAALAASTMALSMFGMMASAEGVEGEEAIVDETPAEETTAAEEVAPAEDEAPAENNPATGNASVALAVIPVALAAAAIVAKKAK